MKVRVLIVDEHPIIAEGLRRVLGNSPLFEVVGQGGDGLQAIQLAEELRPDVVIMAVRLARMNGIEATAEIRRRVPGTRILIFSMYGDPQYARRALRAGAGGYLVKRAPPREVLEAVQTVHAGRLYLSSEIAAVFMDSFTGGRGEKDVIERLSSRERQVLQLLAEGGTAAHVATTLGISSRTVETYRERLCEKLDIHDLQGLVRYAIRQGLVSLD
jgi:DNA-binding NarL/FixJ family response regulator